MVGGTKPVLRDAITAALQEHGPMSMQELADLLNLPRGRVKGVICAARFDHGRRFFRITGYVSGTASLVPLYGVGGETLRDAPRPSSADLEKARQARHWRKNGAIKRARTLGTPASPWEQLMRGTTACTR